MLLGGIYSAMKRLYLANCEQSAQSECINIKHTPDKGESFSFIPFIDISFNARSTVTQPVFSTGNRKQNNLSKH